MHPEIPALCYELHHSAHPSLDNLRVTESDAKLWLQHKWFGYLAEHRVVRWLSDTRFVVMDGERTIADVSIAEVSS